MSSGLTESKGKQRIEVKKKTILSYGFIFVINGAVSFQWGFPRGWMQEALLLQYFSYLLIVLALVWTIVWLYGSIKTKKTITVVALVLFLGQLLITLGLWPVFHYSISIFEIRSLLFFLLPPVSCTIMASLVWYRFWKEYLVSMRVSEKE